MALISWWPLTGKINDISGNKYHLINNGSDINNTGKIGKCYSFNDANKYLYLPKENQNFQNVFNNNFTITFWFKKYQASGTHGIISYGSINNMNKSLHIIIRNTKIFSFAFYSNDFNTSFIVPDNEWIHYAVVGDKTNMKQKIYINGILYGEREVTSWLNVENENLYIGKYLSYTANGALNDVRIYNHVLSDKEIYDISKAKVLHYTFDEIKKLTIFDISGYNQHTTLDPELSPTFTTDSAIGNGSFNFFENMIKVQLDVYPTETITQSLWIKPRYLPSEMEQTYQNLINENSDSWNLFFYKDYIQWKLIFEDGSNGDRATVNEMYLNKNQWNHLVTVYDGKYSKIYINGVLRDEKMPNKPLKLTSGLIRIGNDNTDTILWSFDGLIDDVQIYATPLTENDVQYLYQNRASLDNKGNLYVKSLNQDYSENKFNITTSGTLNTSSISEVGIVDGLVAWYKLDGDTRDYSGNGFDGENNGATITNGLNQSCYYFDGDDDWIDVPHNDILNITDELTISVWIYKEENNNQSKYEGIVYKANMNDSGYQLFIYDNTKIAFGVVTESGLNRKIITGITLNNWNHIAATYDGTNMKVYRDGVLIYSDSNGMGFILPSTVGLAIGRSFAGEEFKGKIQDVRIYNRVLTDEEIKILYETTGEDNKLMKINHNGTVYLKGEIKEV